MSVRLTASIEQRIADLAAIEQGLALLGDQTEQASATPHQLVARRTQEGSWVLTPYKPPAAREGPGSGRIAADVLNRLLSVPGLTLASLQQASAAKAKACFTLRNGMSIAIWRNFAGFNHVFVCGSTGQVIFGGYVGWDNTQLEDAIREIRRCYA